MFELISNRYKYGDQETFVFKLAVRECSGGNFESGLSEMVLYKFSCYFEN